MGPAAVVAGLSVVKGYVDSKKAKKEAKRAQRYAEGQRGETLGYATPEHYLDLLDQYRGAFREGYMPALRTISDALALGETSAMQGFDADVARRGLSGSGLALAGRSAIRGGRQASYSDALRKYYQDVEESARGQAGQTAAGQVGASLGSTVNYIPKPSITSGVLGGAIQGLSSGSTIGGLMGGGAQGWGPSSWMAQKPAQNPYGIKVGDSYYM